MTEFEPEAVVMRALAALLRRDWPVALSDAEEVLRVEPDDTDARFVKGVASGATGDLETARKELLWVLERSPDKHDAWFNLGRVHAERQEHASAAACYRAALHFDPANQAVLYHLGRELEELGRREEALAAYQEAVNAGSSPADMWNHQGIDRTAEAKEAVARLSGCLSK